MSRILSQDEMDALLTAVPNREGATSETGSRAVPAMTYDFRRPDRVSKDTIRSLHLLHDRFSRNVTSSLSAYLRTGVEVSVAAVEQFSYSEFLMSLPDPTAFYGVGIENFDGLGALELNPALAFAMVDRMLGGAGNGVVPDRALTEIEQTVVDSVVEVILEHLTEIWRPVTDVRFSIEARETRPQMLAIAGRNEIMVLLGFDMKVGDARGLFHVCVPAGVVETNGFSANQGWHQTVHVATPDQRAHLMESLEHVTMDVTALLDTQLRLREVLELAKGDVLSLGVPTSTRICMKVGDRIKYTGRLTIREGRAAVLVERCAVPESLSASGAEA